MLYNLRVVLGDLIKSLVLYNIAAKVFGKEFFQIWNLLCFGYGCLDHVYECLDLTQSLVNVVAPSGA